jgi:hypothetical protein
MVNSETLRNHGFAEDTAIGMLRVVIRLNFQTWTKPVPSLKAARQVMSKMQERGFHWLAMETQVYAGDREGWQHQLAASDER